MLQAGFRRNVGVGLKYFNETTINQGVNNACCIGRFGSAWISPEHQA